MNRLFDKTFIIRLIFLALLAKLVAVAGLFFLPKSGVEKSIAEQRAVPYHAYRYTDAMKITTHKAVKEEKKEEIYQLDNLELKGIYSESGEGFIIVVEKSKPNDTVIVSNGEEFKSYVLKEILPQEAIFERAGKKYNLRLTDKETKGLIAAPLASMATQNQQDSYSTDVVRVISKKNVNHYAGNFKEIWKNIKIDEVKKAGKIAGFEIKNINKDSVFSQLGLKKGDVITKVNNMQLSSYRDAFNIYKRIRNVQSLKVTILRDNQEQDLEYEVF